MREGDLGWSGMEWRDNVGFGSCLWKVREKEWKGGKGKRKGRNPDTE